MGPCSLHKVTDPGSAVDCNKRDFVSWLSCHWGRVAFGRSIWRPGLKSWHLYLPGKYANLLLCVESSNSDQNPIRHHKYQKRSGLGWLWDQAHTAALGLALGQLRLSVGGRGTQPDPGTHHPQPKNEGSLGSVAFTEGGEMPFSQQWFFLTH